MHVISDMTTDRPEYDRMLAKDAAWSLAHDFDGDAIGDGHCTSKGEDIDVNGYRDQDGDEAGWTETYGLPSWKGNY